LKAEDREPLEEYDLETLLEDVEEEYEGQELRNGLETALDDIDAEYDLRCISGIEDMHKSYTYDVSLEDDLYEVEAITLDGRPGRTGSCIEFREK